MKNVIFYYSNSGTTENLAERIRKEFGGELIAIRPDKPYGAYFSALKRAGYERRNNIIAQYSVPNVDISDIDTVFVGYPLWYSEAPTFVLDCLSKFDLPGKRVIPFSTSGASNIKGSLESLKRAVGDATIECPYNQGKLSKDDFDKWVNTVRSS